MVQTPKAFHITRVLSDEISVSWNKTEGADSYQLQYTTDRNQTSHFHNVTMPDLGVSLSATIQSLTGNKFYCFRLSALDSNRPQSTFTKKVCTRTLKKGKPAAPKAAPFLNEKMELSFTLPKHLGGIDIEKEKNTVQMEIIRTDSDSRNSSSVCKRNMTSLQNSIFTCKLNDFNEDGVAKQGKVISYASHAITPYGEGLFSDALKCILPIQPIGGGKVTRDMILCERPPPRIIAALTPPHVVRKTGDTILLTWNASLPALQIGTPLYEIEMNNPFNQTNSFETKFTGTATSTLIENLVPALNYEIRISVSVKTENGSIVRSPYSAIQVMTENRGNCGNPRDIILAAKAYHNPNTSKDIEVCIIPCILNPLGNRDDCITKCFEKVVGPQSKNCLRCQTESVECANACTSCKLVAPGKTSKACQDCIFAKGCASQLFHCSGLPRDCLPKPWGY
eukprot:g5856.t1